MNSMSKCNQRKDADDCNSCKPCPAILKCGASGSATLQSPLSVTIAATPITVASVTVDTSCLCDPCIKLEFASNLIIPAAVTTAIFNFQVYKICSNQFQRIPVGPQWTFSRLLEYATAETFSFFVCDCSTCPDECCTYVVEITPVDLVGIGTILINNATLTALAVGCTTRD